MSQRAREVGSEFATAKQSYPAVVESRLGLTCYISYPRYYSVIRSSLESRIKEFEGNRDIRRKNVRGTR